MQISLERISITLTWTGDCGLHNRGEKKRVPLDYAGGAREGKRGT